MDLNVVLIAPEIPQNTGAIGRLCVCLGAKLHLIKPLGFSLDASYLKRAGLDYWKFLIYNVYDCWDSFLDIKTPQRMLFSSTKGSKSYFEFHFQPGDYLIFGNETKGFPEKFYQLYKENLYVIPMPGKHSRSHNLANAVAIMCYEAFRQIDLTPITSSDNLLKKSVYLSDP